MKLSAIYLMVRAVSGILGLLLIGLLARFLTPEEYGVYSLVLTSGTLLSTVAFQWLREGLLRQMPALSDEASKNALTSTVFWLWITVTGALLVIGSLITYMSNSLMATIAMAALASLIAFHGLNLDRARSQLQTLNYALLWLLRAGLAVSLPFICTLFIELNANIIILTTATSFLAPSLVTLPSWLKTIRQGLNGSLAREIFTYGVPFAAAMMGEHALQVIGRALLAARSDQVEVGVYAAALDTVWMSLMMVALAASAGHIPRVISVYSEGRTYQSSRLLASLLTLLGLLLAPALSILCMFPHEVAVLLLGPDMGVAAAATIPWIAVATTIYAVKLVFFDTALKLARKGSSQLPILVGTLGSFVLVAWVLVPVSGAEGAAQALAAASVVATLATWWAVSRHYRLSWPTSDLFRLATSIALSIGITLCLTSQGDSIVIRALVLAVSYIGAVITLDVHKTRTGLIPHLTAKLIRRE